MNNLNPLLCALADADTTRAYKALQRLEMLSDESDALYPHLPRFLEMTRSDKHVMRLRGFRLFCKQARWDVDGFLDEHMAGAIAILGDAKPTAVRQALAALRDVVPYKKTLWGEIRDQVLAIDCSRYRDTMRSLVAKDVQVLLDVMRSPYA